MVQGGGITLPTWVLPGLFGAFLSIAGAGLIMWQNDGIQDIKMVRNRADIDANHADISKLADEVWLLKGKVAALEAKQDGTLTAVSEGLNDLLRRDRFRRKEER